MTKLDPNRVLARSSVLCSVVVERLHNQGLGGSTLGVGAAMVSIGP